MSGFEQLLKLNNCKEVREMTELTLAYGIPQFQKFTVHIQKYNNVTNSPELRSKLAELPFAYIDSKTVVSIEQLSSAVYKAVLESEYNRMRTRNLHSECILSLSPSSNIGDALKTFGLKEDSTDLIVIKITENNKGESFDGNAFVKGDLVAISNEEFASSADIETIKAVCIH
ncbi:unnamed protein product [Kluyveromyces dobzhanskii CBS 2104]|uniref:EKC/KEOPS complex subunit CGI121 n=1 Tax=Kluyveromyces dobzhanskii CBS 2104 TaxID=1427455 RepID=A0A0A8L2K9_9SACH|nr:unnamed protein product [Kluyveromyces dobzhanskii CBS 2104]